MYHFCIIFYHDLVLSMPLVRLFWFPGGLRALGSTKACKKKHMGYWGTNEGGRMCRKTVSQMVEFQISLWICIVWCLIRKRRSYAAFNLSSFFSVWLPIFTNIIGSFEIISLLQNLIEIRKQSQSWREAFKQDFWCFGWKCVSEATCIKFL